MNDRVRIDRDGATAHVHMTRADKHNALDWDLFQGLLDAAQELRDDRDLRGVILSGDGPSFCAGLDFPAFQKKPGRMLWGFFAPKDRGTNMFQEVAMRWRRINAPVVAAIHGNCFGGGLQIALGADFRFATPDAKLSIMESKWGLIPDMSLTATLPELMPADHAKELTMTGRVITGAEAAELNLITRTADDPVAEAQALLDEIATRSPDAVAATKALFHEAWLAPERDALAIERRIQRKLLNNPNQKLSVKRHLKKQDIAFEPRKYSA